MKLEALFFALAVAAAGLVAAPSADAAPRRAKQGAAAPSFPMKPADYKALVEGRIDKVRETIDKKLDRSGVSADRKKAIHKILDEEAKEIRDEVARASADGSVTEGEAGKIKTLTMGLRAKVRERMRAEKNPGVKAVLDKAKAKAEQERAAKDKAAKAAKEKAAKDEAATKAKAATAAKEKAAKEAAAKAKEAKAKAAKAAAAKPKAGPTKQANTPRKAPAAAKAKGKKKKAAPAEAL